MSAFLVVIALVVLALMRIAGLPPLQSAAVAPVVLGSVLALILTVPWIVDGRRHVIGMPEANHFFFEDDAELMVKEIGNFVAEESTHGAK